MVTVQEVQVNDLSQSDFSEQNIFICSTSFEERCLTIPKALQNNNFNKVLICHFENNYDAAEIHLKALKRGLKNYEVVSFKKENPIYNLDGIVKAIGTFKHSHRLEQVKIVIDITTFTHEMLMILIFLFKKYFRRPEYEVQYLYSSATDYSVNEIFENKWLSKGVGQIRSVLGFGGQLLPGKKTALIIFVGFEDERVKSIIDLYEPSKVILGHASLSGAINEELQRKNKSIFERLLRTLRIQVETFEFSCITPTDSKNLLNNFISSNIPEYNIIVASLNNKLSTMGCALSVIDNPDVQICYPTATSYNTSGYSRPGNRAFIINL